MTKKPSPKTPTDNAASAPRATRTRAASAKAADGDLATIDGLAAEADADAADLTLRGEDIVSPTDIPVPSPTAAIAAPMILLMGEAPNGLAAALPGFVLRTVDAAQTPDANLRAALAPALAIVAATGREAEARSYADALGLPDIAVLPAADAAIALPRALATRLAVAERDAGQARRAAAVLRRETEAVNRRLHAIERFMYSLGGPRLSQALQWPPAEQIINAEAEGTVLTQRLPIDSPGITGVDLWLPDADEVSARALGVAIEDSEAVRHPLTLDEVSLGRDDGWLRFGSDEPLSGDRQDCRLIVEHIPHGLGVGLGPAVPDPLFAVQGGPETERVLALRVWRAIAGSTLNAIGAGTAIGRGRAEGTVAKRVMPADLPRPLLLASPKAAVDHISTAFWQQEDAILVHPSSRGPVCAMLQRVPLANLSRLSAVVHAPRRDGPPLSFALGVAPSGGISEEDWDEFIGPWVTLPPGGWGEVQASLRRAPLPGRLCDIVLATAVSGGASNENAWALFRAFRAVWRQDA